MNSLELNAGSSKDRRLRLPRKPEAITQSEAIARRTEPVYVAAAAPRGCKGRVESELGSTLAKGLRRSDWGSVTRVLAASEERDGTLMQKRLRGPFRPRMKPEAVR